jgi:hypothetical protein
MKIAAKKFINLFLYTITVFALLAISALLVPLQVSIPELLLSTIVFAVITALAQLVFLIGTERNPERQPLYTMGAVGLKLFLLIIYAVVYFIVLKNTGAVYIILFFLLYLAFTIYLLRVVVKILKVKSLK